MIDIKKDKFIKASLAGIFSAFTIGVLTLITYKTELGLFLTASFGSSMVLLYGFPESPFAQPKNIFFWPSSYCTCWGNFCKLYSTTNIHNNSCCCRFRNFFNDYFRCCSPSCWR